MLGSEVMSPSSSSSPMPQSHSSCLDSGKGLMREGRGGEGEGEGRGGEGGGRGGEGLPESLQFGRVSDVGDERGILAEVLLHPGMEGVVWTHHQGRVVAHLTQVLKSLQGQSKRVDNFGGSNLTFNCQLFTNLSTVVLQIRVKYLGGLTYRTLQVYFHAKNS